MARLIPQDGSVRHFYRLQLADTSLILMYSPHNIPECRAWLYFNHHLASLGLPVPALLAADAEQGLFLMNDLGATSLQDAALACQGDGESLFHLYRPVIEMLAVLQTRGTDNLDISRCFDGTELDAPFLLQREMGYFYEHLGARYNKSPSLYTEFRLIARQAALARPHGLTHRDMQSRNLVVSPEGALGLIDFQGARLGPAQYDLASLLNDVYVDLPRQLRVRLVDLYVQHLMALRPFDEEKFYQGWPWVALSRNLQTLGAFAFLSGVQGKPQFARYISPALANLQTLLDDPALAGLSSLKKLAHTISRKLWPTP